MQLSAAALPAGLRAMTALLGAAASTGEDLTTTVLRTEFALTLSAAGKRIRTIVPRKAPVVVLVSVLVRADFSVSAESTGGDMTLSKTRLCHAVPTVRIRLPPAERDGMGRRRGNGAIVAVGN